MNILYIKIAAALALIVALSGAYLEIRHKGVIAGRAEIQGKWDASKAADALAEKVATDARIAENKILAGKQDSINQKITEASNVELTKLRTALAGSRRLHIGPAFCGGTVAASADTQSTSGSDSTDTGGRILSEGVDGATKALILKTEEVAAIGRACQAFVIENKLAP